MKCRKCGIENPINANKCMYCHTPFNNKNQKSKQSNNVIIIIILILALVFVGLMGAYIYESTRTRSNRFRGGGGGGYVTTVTPAPATAMPTAVAAADGALSGRVADFASRTPIVGGQISGVQSNTAVMDAISGGSYLTTLTDTSGSFLLPMPNGKYRVFIKATGYMTCNIDNIEIVQGETTYLENTILLKEISGNPLSNAGGTVTNAVSGEPVSGVQLKFRRDWGNKSGAYMQSSSRTEIVVTTDENGVYYTEALPYGYYTAEVVKEGYSTQYVNIISTNHETASKGQDIVLVPEASGNDFRITLEWDEAPRDNDAHIKGDWPYEFHVYYNNKAAYMDGNTIATLDHDDTEGNGFETITLTADSAGTYKYYVYNYSADDSLANSNARVKVYQGGVMIKQYNVPVDRGNGRYWNVFNIVNGEVVTINTISDSDG